MAIKPTYKPEHATNTVADGPLGGNNKTRPPASIRDEGWAFPSFPAREHLNWQLSNNKEWVDYFETVTDAGLGLGANFAREPNNETTAFEFATAAGFHRTYNSITPVPAIVIVMAASTTTTIVVNTNTNVVEAIAVAPSIDQEPIWSVVTDGSEITSATDLRVTPARTIKRINLKSGSDVTLNPDDLDDTSTANKFTNAADISRLSLVEAAATADQTDGEIETAYNNQVSAGTDAEISTGSEVAIRRWSPIELNQAIIALTGIPNAASVTYSKLSGSVSEATYGTEPESFE